jgi:hypothetical protein
MQVACCGIVDIYLKEDGPTSSVSAVRKVAEPQVHAHRTPTFIVGVSSIRAFILDHYNAATISQSH